MLSARLNGKQFVPWKKRGWKLVDQTAGSNAPLYIIEAYAPDCSKLRLDLYVEERKIFAVYLMVAPVHPKRKWRKVTGLEGFDWASVPAPWFRLKVGQLLQEAKHDEQRRAS